MMSELNVSFFSVRPGPRLRASQSEMFDSVCSLLSLTVNTSLLAILIKYYKTIPFVKRNIVLHLNISTCCLIYGSVVLQVIVGSYKQELIS